MRQILYGESPARQTHTGTTGSVEKTGATFVLTPNPGANYLLFWSGLLDANTAATVTANMVNLTAGGGGFQSVGRTNGAIEKVPVGGMVVWNSGVLNTPQTWGLKQATANAGNTVGFQEATPASIEMTAADEFIYLGTAAGDITTSSNTYQTSGQLTFTPPTTGDYLILAYTVMLTPNQTDCCLRMFDGTNAWGVAEPTTSVNSGSYMPYFTIAQRTLPGGVPISLTLQMKTLTAVTMTTRRTCIVALRVDNGLSRVKQWEDRAASTTTSNSMQDKLSVGLSALNTSDTLVFMSMLTNGNTGATDHRVESYVNGATVGIPAVRRTPSAVPYLPYFKLFRLPVTARSNNLRLRYSSDGATTLTAQEASIAVLQSGGDDLYFGSKVPDIVRLGDNPVDRMYLGSTKVYGF